MIHFSLKFRLPLIFYAYFVQTEQVKVDTILLRPSTTATQSSQLIVCQVLSLSVFHLVKVAKFTFLRLGGSRGSIEELAFLLMAEDSKKKKKKKKRTNYDLLLQRPNLSFNRSRTDYCVVAAFWGGALNWRELNSNLKIRRARSPFPYATASASKLGERSPFPCVHYLALSKCKDDWSLTDVRQ